MNIGIDARLFGPEIGGGGLGRYVEQLVTGLDAVEQQHGYVIFLKPENREKCRLTNPRFEKRTVPIHWYTLKEQLFFGRIIDQEGLDLVHFPHWNVPFNVKTPFIVTIHDLILLEEPFSSRASMRHPFSYLIRHFLFRQILKRAIERSVRIIAVSEYTKNAILRFFPKTPAEKITVIYEGITPLVSTLSQEPLIQTPYFLYVGNVYPHKNLEFLIRAFAKFQTIHPELTLVIAGRNDFFLNRLKQETTNTHIRFFPNPTDVDLAHLYQHATLFVFPSKTEGFGLPPLEALSHHLPVVASTGGSLPEILGNSALYFSPKDLEEAVSAMEKGYTNQAARTALISNGDQRITHFSWQTMIEETRNLYVWRNKI